MLLFLQPVAYAHLYAIFLLFLLFLTIPSLRFGGGLSPNRGGPKVGDEDIFQHCV